MTPHGNKLKGLKISHFNRCMIVISCILYVLLLRATVVVSRNYEQLVGATREYIRLENAATDILKASDYLTEQARLYVQTLDPKHAQLYFEEANVIRRRESALARMAPYSSDKDYLSSLTTAAQHSNELMVREVYAMKLIAVAEGHPEAELPAEVNAVCLEQDDLVLSRQEKLEKARSLLFDAEYQLTKSIIYDHLDLFTQKVMLMTKDNLTDGLDYLSQSIHTHRMLLSILIGLNLVTFFVITLLVVKPLKIFLECVQSQTLFHPTGAYEFKYLAHVYNDIYQRSDSLAASEAHLRQKAEHDGLTGILNRYMFQKVCALLSDSTAPLALVLIDVDKFKNINDTYGHTAGDQVLIRVAQTLKDNLRGSDYVFRIGGDEFAAILPEVTGDNVVAVCNKLLRINEGLQTPDGTVPGVSLSIGITLSEHGYHDALYKQADTALYWIKKHGRCGCMVYKEELENNQ